MLKIIERLVKGVTNNYRIMKKILFLVNHDVAIYNFRLELVERFLHDGYEVHQGGSAGSE